MGPVFLENYRDPPGLMDEGIITEEKDNQQEGSHPQEEADKYQKMSDKLANAVNDI